ncbi:MAG TPA: hypothetical protein DCO72_01570 [Ruminococcus sp.]|nr:hypothetical protein [Ruminococcus sp.]
MNKWEKEVQQSLLNDEQQVLKILKMAYADTLRDVEDRMSGYFARITANPNDTSAIYQYRYQQALQGQLQDILDNLHQENYQTISDYLNHSYENGYLGAMYDIHRQGIPIITPINQENVVRAITINSKISVPMYTRLGTDINLLKTAIAGEVTRGIASGSMWHDVASRIADKTGISSYNAMRIARTEGHRVQCNAQYDACQSAKQSGADVVNQWDSTMDNRTRDTHRRLHGQLREVGYPFEIDGMTADYPGAFGIPSEDIHCRCAMLQRARWALSPDELAQLQNTSEAKQLAQTADFEEFKNKYLELTEKLPYSGERGLTSPLESGTIESADELANRQARYLYSGLTKEQRKEVIQRGQSTEKPVFSYDTQENVFPSNAQKIPKEENTFDVISHGLPDRMEFFVQDYPDKDGVKDPRRHIDAYTLSAILKGRKDYTDFISSCKEKGVDPVVRLLSCNTGNTTDTGNCFAQLLANELGVNVKAPTKVIYALPSGEFYVGDYADGTMQMFYPRK